MLVVSLFVVYVLFFRANTIVAQNAAQVAQNAGQGACGGTILKPGDLIKVVGGPSYYAINRKSEVISIYDGNVYKSWKPTYNGNKIISVACHESLLIPRVLPVSVIYRSGTAVVKRENTNQLYVVEPKNTLAKISKDAAKTLYGNNFSAAVIKNIDWPNYVNRGQDVMANIPHPGMLIKITRDVNPIKKNTVYYVDFNKVLMKVTENGLNNGFTANGFQQKFVRTIAPEGLAGFVVSANIIDKPVFTMFDEMIN